MMYKVQNDMISIPQTLFQQYSRHSRRSQAVFILPYCRTDGYKFSFVPTCIKIWNGLPPQVRDSRSLNSFKTSIDDINVSCFYWRAQTLFLLLLLLSFYLELKTEHKIWYNLFNFVSFYETNTARSTRTIYSKAQYLLSLHQLVAFRL